VGNSPYRRSAPRPETDREPVPGPTEEEQVEDGRGCGWQVDVEFDASLERSAETTRRPWVPLVELLIAGVLAAFVSTVICLGVNVRTTEPAAASAPSEPTERAATLDASVNATSDASHE